MSDTLRQIKKTTRRAEGIVGHSTQFVRLFQSRNVFFEMSWGVADALPHAIEFIAFSDF
jgi:hypothetical protein